MPRNDYGPSALRFLEHPSGARVLTGLEVVLRDGVSTPPALAAFRDDGLLTVSSGPEHLLVLTFDANAQARTVDLRQSGVPIVFNY